jgi:hypothetical protein
MKLDVQFVTDNVEVLRAGLLRAGEAGTANP